VAKQSSKFVLLPYIVIVIRPEHVNEMTPGIMNIPSELG
jgi:hypothetical protein